MNEQDREDVPDFFISRELGKRIFALIGEATPNVFSDAYKKQLLAHTSLLQDAPPDMLVGLKEKDRILANMNIKNAAELLYNGLTLLKQAEETIDAPENRQAENWQERIVAGSRERVKAMASGQLSNNAGIEEVMEHFEAQISDSFEKLGLISPIASKGAGPAF